LVFYRTDKILTEDTVIRMWINPSRMAIQNRKVISRIQTNTRWVFQHWGVEPTVLQYSGWTGYMSEPLIDISSSTDSIYNSMPVSTVYESKNYQNFQAFRKFYEDPHRELANLDLTSSDAKIDALLAKLTVTLIYRHIQYTGFFMRMDLQEDEMSPWNWQYNMEFQAYKVSDQNIFPYDLDMRTVQVAYDTSLVKSLSFYIDTSNQKVKSASINRTVTRAYNVYKNPRVTTAR